MIRDRLKRAARKAALKAFGMEKDAEDRTTHRPPANPDSYDASKIPKLQDGSGDTPGPNHKELIGRTWMAAQVSGGVLDLVVDIRPPQEWSGGHLPGATLLPNRQILDRTDLLPADKEARITVYDATGEQGSFELAAELRQRGWITARCLEGGWAEWLEHDEPQTAPPKRPDHRHALGAPVELTDGRRGVVQAQLIDGGYDVLLDFDKNLVEAGVPEDGLRP